MSSRCFFVAKYLENNYVILEFVTQVAINVELNFVCDKVSIKVALGSACDKVLYPVFGVSVQIVEGNGGVVATIFDVLAR